MEDFETYEQFVTYEQAVKLKEVGFDWITYAFYLGTTLNTKIPSWQIANTTDLPIISAPTLSQAQKWLRVVKDIIIGIDFDNWYDKYECHVYKRMGYKGENIRDTYGSQRVTNEYHEDFDTYEQALSAAIDKSLEILKTN